MEEQSTRLGSEWLGRRLSVRIDRPIGSPHPEYPDITYSVNYGYIPGTISGDGEPIDVYVMAEPRPLVNVAVFIAAIIHRHDDIEDKLVGCRELLRLSPAEVMQAVAFTEQWFDVTIETLMGQARYEKRSRR